MLSMEKIRIGLFLITLSLMIFPNLTGAEELISPIVPLPSVMDYTKGQGWGIALGLGTEYETAYDGSDEYELEIEPAGAIQWRKGNHLFFWEGIELGWRSRMEDIWLVQLAARYESGREADDSDDGRLDGLEDKDSHVVAVAEFRRALNSDWRNWFGLRVMAGADDFGILGVLAAGHRFGSKSDGTGTEAFIFTTLGNSDFINKDFGVTATESMTSGLARTDLDGGYRSVGINLIDRRYVTHHIQIITQAGFELYSDDIQDSPIAREDFEMEFGLSAVYHF